MIEWRFIRQVATAATIALVAAAPAHAAIVLSFNNASSSTNGTPSGVSGAAAFSFSQQDATGVKVDVAVTNTSSAPVTSSRLTGFGFDLFSGVAYRTGSFAATLNSAGEGLDSLVQNGSLASITLALCAFSGNNCGSNPGNGITNGNSAGFSVVLNTLLAPNQVESGFASLFNFVAGTPGPATSAMRWQQIQINGSGDFSDTLYNPVPLPAPILMLLGGLAGLGFAARKRKTQAA